MEEQVDWNGSETSKEAHGDEDVNLKNGPVYEYISLKLLWSKKNVYHQAS